MSVAVRGSAPIRPHRGPSLVQSLASNWLALGISVGISFVLSPIVVNSLGAAWYGVWAIAAQFTGYMYLLDFGVRESIIRYTSKYTARHRPRQLSRVLTAALLIYSATTALALLLTALGVWLVPRWFDLEPRYWTDTRLALGFAGLTIAQTFLFNVFTGIVMGLRRWDIGNAMGVIFSLIGAGLTALLLMRGGGIVALASVQFAVSFARGVSTAVVALGLLRRNDMTFHPVRLGRRALVALCRRIFGYGFYVIVNNIGEKLIAATDAIVIGLFLPVATVAYYAIAGNLVGVLRAILTSTAQIFNPLASHLQTARQGAELRRAFVLGVTISVLLTLPGAAGFVILGEEFIGLWMGQPFAEPSANVLSILAVTAALSAPQFIMSSILYGISRHRVIAVLRIVEGVVNLVLSVVFVQALGLVGVAIGTAIPSVIIALLVLPTIACRFTGVSLFEYYERGYVRPLIAVVPFSIAALWLRATFPAHSLGVFFLHVAGLLCVYVPSAFAIGLNAAERRLVLSRFGFQHAS